MSKKKKDSTKSFLDMLMTFMITLLIFVSFRYFIRFPTVHGQSMEPTYHDGDVLAVVHTENVDTNDIIILWSDDLNEYLIKRVIGVPGDTIVIKDGSVYRNGTKLYEAYINSAHWMTDDETWTLGSNEYFVMGDNRDHSTDSREIGVVTSGKIFGRVLFSVISHGSQ